MTVLLSLCVWPGAGSEYVLYAVFEMWCGVDTEASCALEAKLTQVSAESDRLYFCLVEPVQQLVARIGSKRATVHRLHDC